MNRVILSVLSQKSNLRRQDIETLSQLCQPRPLQCAWKSEKFPIFPFQINFYLSNPPFNKITLSIPSQLRTKIQIFGSKGGKEYFKLEQINEDKDDFDDFSEGGIVSKFFKRSQDYNYLRLKFYAPKESKEFKRICKQVGLRAIEVSNIIYFNTKYLCSLRKRLQFHPNIFRILQLYEYKTMVIQKEKPTRYTTQLKEKYIKRMNEIQDLVYKKKIDQIHPDPEIISKLSEEFQQLLEEPILQAQELDFSNPVEIKQKIKNLQQNLAQFYVDRLMNLQANVSDYFQKYWNNQIRDIYLRLLSSPQDQDKTKALVEYWSQIKALEQISPNIEEATLMFFNYYLEFINNHKIKLGAMKIMSLFLKFEKVGMKLYHVYGRIFFNLIHCLEFDSNQEIYKLAYKAVFLLYAKLPHSIFVRELLNRETHARTVMKLKKLQILERIILNDQSFHIDKQQDKQLMLQFLLDVLLIKELSIQQKNSAYSVIAFLAASFGKEQVMSNFDKLNSMLLMNMEKIIDKKLSKLKSPQTTNQTEFRTMCDYCGQQNPEFKDQNVYDIHCFKQCKILVSCQYCSCIVEIPQLPKHYLEECTLKNKFKNCQNCNDVIFIDKEDQHKKKCLKKLLTKCPLCEQKLQSKLRIKQHVLKDGCPNNSRNQK